MQKSFCSEQEARIIRQDSFSFSTVTFFNTFTSHRFFQDCVITTFNTASHFNRLWIGKMSSEAESGQYAGYSMNIAIAIDDGWSDVFFWSGFCLSYIVEWINRLRFSKHFTIIFQEEVFVFAFTDVKYCFEIHCFDSPLQFLLLLGSRGVLDWKYSSTTGNFLRTHFNCSEQN